MSTVSPIPGPDPQGRPPFRILGTPRVNAEATAEEIAKMLALFIEPGQDIEVGELLTDEKYIARHFDSVQIAANRIAASNPNVVSTYFALNPYDPLRLAADRDARRVSDRHITCRRWILIDCDRIKTKETRDLSSTDEEKAEAERLALAVREGLRAEGWPDPVLADSGNGWHLLYRVDLPNDEEAKGLVRQVLATLADRFNTDQAEIDTVVFNASRVTKAYGSMTRKGSNGPNRPHRASSLVHVPETLEPVPRALLEAMAPKPVETPTPPPLEPTPRSSSRGSRLTVEERAIRYLDKCPPAISGAKGHRQAFKTACAFGPGFNLREDVAIRLFREHYNPKCDPTWSEKEIVHKISDAYKVESRRGWLLKEDKRAAARDGTRSAAPAAAQGLSGKALHVEMGKLECTDLGNAGRLVGRHGKNIRFCHSWGQWLIWDGKRWSIDQTGKIVRLTKATVRDILNEAHAAENDQDRTKLSQWAIKSQDAKHINAMMQLARSELSVAITHDQLDTHPFLFNVQNGTLDLRTGILTPHRREDLLTQVCPVAYDPDADCPLWDQTLATFFRREDPQRQADLIAYFQRLCGYAMAAVTDEHILPICHGVGSNGKSTLLELVLDTFGPDYAIKAPDALLMAKKTDSHPTEMASLFGKRLVIAIETDEGRRLNESRVKALTGGDTISARRMREDFWTFKPSHTLFMGTNHLPKVRGTDHGIWRRLKEIPFTVTVTGDAADAQMPRKIRGTIEGFHSELPGILAWCVRGFLDWQAGGLREPEEVLQATAKYRRSEDPVAGFLDERVVQVQGARIKAIDLYKAYEAWAESRNEPHIVSQRVFGENLATKGYETMKSNGVKYCDIALLSDREEPE